MNAEGRCTSSICHKRPGAMIKSHVLILVDIVGVKTHPTWRAAAKPAALSARGRSRASTECTSASKIDTSL